MAIYVSQELNNQCAPELDGVNFEYITMICLYDEFTILYDQPCTAYSYLVSTYVAI